jgi:type III restriction enzyme
MTNLQDKLNEEFGRRYINGLEIPDYFTTGLSQSKPLRPYQEDCFKYFLTYMNPENEFDGKQIRPNLLFHMATGSGKTLVMAGAMLYLYEQGYRNFLFFVDSTNIVEKTKDNFLNPASIKYLFADPVTINGKRVEIRQVQNFQGANTENINICLTTIQALHSDLNTEHEGAVTFEEFSDKPIVLISDEAHHMNAATKRGTAHDSNDEHTKDWESTVMRIFDRDNGYMPNVLLEFTATADLTDPAIAKKYEDKVIFDYPLKKFREDKYSKDVEVVESDLEALDMAIQAMILSQYKRKLFADIHQDIKPVVLFKSKTIAANKEIFTEFLNSVSRLAPKDIRQIRARAKDDLKAAFDYVAKSGITDENLILELREEFSDDRLLLVDGNNISPEKQKLLNSLESPTNKIRGIFAVDMLNEGWDVLNLFDIVRLYDTRDAANNKVGKTTMQEAQLIGRGARYMPFVDQNNPTLEFNRRKYDGDNDNPLRVVEKLHYHSKHNPRYIQELKSALVQTGIMPDNKVQLSLFIKDDFKGTRLYNNGLVFSNERKTLAEVEDDGTIGSAIQKKVFSVSMPTGKMRSGLIFGEGAKEEISSVIINIKMKELGNHVIRSAMDNFSILNYDSLHKLYPQLKSCRQFAEEENYLANLNIKVSGAQNSIDAYSQQDKLFIAKSVLKELQSLLITRGKSFRGTEEFKPVAFNNAFRDKITLNVTIPAVGTQEFGVSMKTPKDPKYTLDLEKVKWYAYNDNFGTSEEKALVKYIEGIMPKLEEKYDDVYLVRNEKDVRIYSFDTGQAFEPDYVLFLRVKGTTDKYDNLQLFIEPKGGHLLASDKWKNDFLKQIKNKANITWSTKADNFQIWGIPFFNESANTEFETAINDGVLKYVPSAVEDLKVTHLIVVSTSDVSENDKYTKFLPVYSLRAACGVFDAEETVEEDGWVEVTGYGKLGKDMFVAKAVGDSMEPDIKDGDFLLFKKYSGGSREGKIMLFELNETDSVFDGDYCVKKYHSEKVTDPDTGEWSHDKITLQPLNPAYHEIPVVEGDQIRPIAEFQGVIE